MRLIDADALMERYGEPCHSFLDVIEDMPTIDAVPVVRCKDCEYWERDWVCSSGNPGNHYCSMIDRITYPDFYCKHGVRMDGEAHDAPG